MYDVNSSILDFYPLDFEQDLNGKKQEWEAVVKIPFIDEQRLLKAMAGKSLSSFSGFSLFNVRKVENIALQRKRRRGTPGEHPSSSGIIQMERPSILLPYQGFSLHSITAHVSWNHSTCRHLMDYTLFQGFAMVFLLELRLWQVSPLSKLFPTPPLWGIMKSMFMVYKVGTNP